MSGPVFYEGELFEPLNSTNHHVTLFDNCRRITNNDLDELPDIAGTSVSILEFFSKKANVFQTAALVSLPGELLVDFEAWALHHSAPWADNTNSGRDLHISLWTPICFTTDLAFAGLIDGGCRNEMVSFASVVLPCVMLSRAV